MGQAWVRGAQAWDQAATTATGAAGLAIELWCAPAVAAETAKAERAAHLHPLLRQLLAHRSRVQPRRQAQRIPGRPARRAGGRRQAMGEMGAGRIMHGLAPGWQALLELSCARESMHPPLSPLTGCCAAGGARWPGGRTAAARPTPARWGARRRAPAPLLPALLACRGRAAAAAAACRRPAAAQSRCGGNQAWGAAGKRVWATTETQAPSGGVQRRRDASKPPLQQRPKDSEERSRAGACTARTAA